jgi:negative regulator of flagellin synthesis FlgM
MPSGRTLLLWSGFEEQAPYFQAKRRFKMKITGGNPFGKIDDYVKQINKNKSKSAAVSKDNPSAGNISSGDKVELSPEAKMISQAIKAVEALPDVRENKVAEIRERIANGTYRIDGKEVAEKMIKESFLNQPTKTF